MLLRKAFRAFRSIATVMLCFATVLMMAAGNSDSTAKEPKAIGQLYVAPTGDDRSDGSAKHPWATLQHAAAKVEPGSIVHVASGLYVGGITSSTSGNPMARIRFVSATKWSARIRSVGSYATWTNDGDFVDIVGFDISGDGAIGLLNRGSNVRIISNHVHDVPARGCTGNGGAGILNGNYSAMDNDIVGNVVHDIGEANKSCPRVHGIYHSNLRGHILNNISYGNQGYGIHLWHAAAEVTIAHNLVFNNRHGGILIGAGDAPYRGSALHPVDRILVANNIVVYNQNRYGIEELGITGVHNVYLNNLVFGNHFADWKLQTGRQSGTITADPRFIAYREDGSGDYHLSTVSPSLRKGTSLGAPAFDIDGCSRPREGAWDIGPYQQGPTEKCLWPPDACRPDCKVNLQP
jgi:pectate disaccharide-lyase